MQEETIKLVLVIHAYIGIVNSSTVMHMYA